MTSLKEEALNYEAPQTRNIADLEKVPTDITIVEKTYKEGTEDEFKIKVVAVDDEDYRVPNSVLNSLKAILEENPELKYFKVKREGTGLKTNYTVIPLA